MAETSVMKRPNLSMVAKLRKKWIEIYKARWPYLFISPFYILFLIFGVYPILFSLYLSFTEWKGLGPIKFVGWKNFELLLKDKLFWHSVENGVILFFMYVPIMTFLALVLAVILNSRRIRFFQAFRTVIFAPWVTSMIAAGFTFRLLLENDGGLFNAMLTSLGMPTVPWLESVWGGRISLSLLVMWGWLGYNMVLMLTGLQTIPLELSEAARIDGASNRQVFFYITIPLMRPIILFSVILSTIG